LVERRPAQRVRTGFELDRMAVLVERPVRERSVEPLLVELRGNEIELAAIVEPVIQDERIEIARVERELSGHPERALEPRRGEKRQQRGRDALVKRLARGGRELVGELDGEVIRGL